MVQIVLDLEGNGLLDTIDKIWCICVKWNDQTHTFCSEVDDGEVDIWKLSKFKYWLECQMVDVGLNNIELIGHNIIAYDIPVMEKILGISFEGIKVIDTLVMSRVLNHERGEHSLQAWGKRMGGEQKVEQEVWHTFDPNMITRCQSDVRLTEAVYQKLCGEINATVR